MFGRRERLRERGGRSELPTACVRIKSKERSCSTVPSSTNTFRQGLDALETDGALSRTRSTWPSR